MPGRATAITIRLLKWVGVIVAAVLVATIAVYWAMERPRGGEAGELARGLDCRFWQGEQAGVTFISPGGEREGELTTTDPDQVSAMLANHRSLMRHRTETFTSSFETVSGSEVWGLFSEEGLVRVIGRAQLQDGTWAVTGFADCSSYFDQ